MYDNLGKRANDLTKVFEQKYKANSYKHNGFKETQNREKELQLERLNQNLANLNNNRW